MKQDQSLPAKYLVLVVTTRSRQEDLKWGPQKSFREFGKASKAGEAGECFGCYTLALGQS